MTTDEGPYPESIVFHEELLQQACTYIILLVVTR